MSDASHSLAGTELLADYVRYCASVSSAPQNPSEPVRDGKNATPRAGKARNGLPARPGGIVVISAIVAAEATALLVAATWYGGQLVTGAPVLSFWGAVFTLGLLLAFSVWLYAVSVFLFRGYRWPRAGALVAQLFTLTIGFPTISGGYLFLGLAMLVPAVLALILLFEKRVITFGSRTGGAPPAL